MLVNSSIFQVQLSNSVANGVFTAVLTGVLRRAPCLPVRHHAAHDTFGVSAAHGQTGVVDCHKLHPARKKIGTEDPAITTQYCLSKLND